jgi:hypothetical protein
MVQPASARIDLMLSITWRVCTSMLPSTSWPLASIAIWPETKTKSPARTAFESGGFMPPGAVIPPPIACLPITHPPCDGYVVVSVHMNQVARRSTWRDDPDRL